MTRHIKHHRLNDLPEQPFIRYDNTVVVLGGGDCDADLYHALVGYALNGGTLDGVYPIVAADSGGDLALSYGKSPDWIIGDLDSASPQAIARAGNILEISDQHSTDFEKVLASVHAPQALAFGFLGHRMDHSLAALHALAGVDPSMAVVLVGSFEAIVFCRGDFTAVLPPLTRFSLWPLRRQSFHRSQGLVWPLDGLSLEAGGTLGTSNQTIAGDHDIEVSIAAAEGQGYFVMIESKLAGRLITPD